MKGRFLARDIPLEQTKKEILSLLATEPEDEFNPYDLAMALELPLEAVIEALAELEREKKIKPLGDALRSETIGDLSIELNPVYDGHKREISAGRKSESSSGTV